MYVDPLDGTRNFIKGALDKVTTLIGLTYNGRPVAGIISRPFQKKGETYESKPSIYFSMKDIK